MYFIFGFIYICIQLYVFKYIFCMIFLYSRQKANYVITGAIVTIIFLFFNWMSVPHYPPVRSSSKQKLCLSNLRVLQGSVEMYNMDHETDPMKELDIGVLLKEKYLKEEPNHPEKACNYLSKGDLSNEDDEGEVYCPVHGSVSNPNLDYDKYLIEHTTRKSNSERIADGVKEICNSILRFLIISLGIFNLYMIFRF